MSLSQTVSSSAPLGQKTGYPKKYDKNLLFGVSRAKQREALRISNIPFFGYDIWNSYEISWLNLQKKPIRKILTIKIPADSTNIIESKSAKLYFNSLNYQIFSSEDQILKIIKSDLSEITNSHIEISFADEDILKLNENFPEFVCLDDLEVMCNAKSYSPNILQFSPLHIHEKLYTNLFKSHCLVTDQPDWASVFIEYIGPKIDHQSLLKYLISFHEHRGFSENVIEQVFTDILSLGKPQELTIFARFTRRGGIDINPVRSTNKNIDIANIRLHYQ